MHLTVCAFIMYSNQIVHKYSNGFLEEKSFLDKEIFWKGQRVMLLKECIELFELLDSPSVSGYRVKEFFQERGASTVDVRTLESEKGFTDFIRIVVEGSSGRRKAGDAPTLGITGRLGGLGARPRVTGFVSDGDGALAALASALKLVDMAKKGDRLPGDVVISTHICPNAPVVPHDPVPLMDSPIDTRTAHPYTNNKIEEGFEVTVIALKAREVFRSPRGLLTLGPRAFGFDIEYKPVEKLLS
jgi:hypothetical protein